MAFSQRFEALHSLETTKREGECPSSGNSARSIIEASALSDSFFSIIILAVKHNLFSVDMQSESFFVAGESAPISSEPAAGSAIRMEAELKSVDQGDK